MYNRLGPRFMSQGAKAGVPVAKNFVPRSMARDFREVRVKINEGVNSTQIARRSGGMVEDMKNQPT